MNHARLDAVLRTASRLAASRLDARPQGAYPYELRIEFAKADGLRELVDFFRYVAKTANGGHSFSIEADREGNAAAKAKVFIDGDGSDKFGRILLNGEDILK